MILTSASTKPRWQKRIVQEEIATLQPRSCCWWWWL